MKAPYRKEIRAFASKPINAGLRKHPQIMQQLASLFVVNIQPNPALALSPTFEERRYCNYWSQKKPLPLAIERRLNFYI